MIDLFFFGLLTELGDNEAYHIFRMKRKFFMRNIEKR